MFHSRSRLVPVRSRLVACMAWSARKSLDPLRIQKMTKMWSPMGRSHDCPHRQGSFQCVVDTNVLALMRFSPHPHQLSMRCSVSVIVGTANDTAFGAVCIMNIILLLIYVHDRTSQTSWFNTKPQQKHWVVEDFEDRIDSLLRSPIVADFHSPPSNPRPPLTRRRRDRENLQLIHYDPGQVYHLHYDKVDDHDKNGDADRDGQRKARTRAATLLTYVSPSCHVLR